MTQKDIHREDGCTRKEYTEIRRETQRQRQTKGDKERKTGRERERWSERGRRKIIKCIRRLEAGKTNRKMVSRKK